MDIVPLSLALGSGSFLTPAVAEPEVEPVDPYLLWLDEYEKGV
jgi:hypothetical protein